MKDNVVILSRTMPAIRLCSGLNYTGTQFNKDLRKLLKDEVDYKKESITAHSFHAGKISGIINKYLGVKD